MMNRRTFLGTTAASVLALALPALPSLAQAVDTSSVNDMVMGSDDAPITMIEYASFTCPHCRTFHENAFKDLQKDYIDTGKVKFIFREVYFDRYGLWAGMVARCNEDRYFGIVDMIFEQQAQWTQGEPAQIAGNLRKMGLLAGLDGEKVDACMRDADQAAALNAYFEETTTADNVRSTPTFMINGVQHNNMGYAQLKQVLDAEL